MALFQVCYFKSTVLRKTNPNPSLQTCTTVPSGKLNSENRHHDPTRAFKSSSYSFVMMASRHTTTQELNHLYQGNPLCFRCHHGFDIKSTTYWSTFYSQTDCRPRDKRSFSTRSLRQTSTRCSKKESSLMEIVFKFKFLQRSVLHKQVTTYANTPPHPSPSG